MLTALTKFIKTLTELGLRYYLLHLITNYRMLL